MPERFSILIYDEDSPYVDKISYLPARARAAPLDCRDHGRSLRGPVPGVDLHADRNLQRAGVLIP